MKLPDDTLIAHEKLTQYLLALRKRNDKSQWLAQAGYAIENWEALENDIRNQILSAKPRRLKKQNMVKCMKSDEIQSDRMGAICQCVQFG